jgi:hypothetical protein
MARFGCAIFTLSLPHCFPHFLMHQTWLKLELEAKVYSLTPTYDKCPNKLTWNLKSRRTLPPSEVNSELEAQRRATSLPQYGFVSFKTTVISNGGVSGSDGLSESWFSCWIVGCSNRVLLLISMNCRTRPRLNDVFLLMVVWNNVEGRKGSLKCTNWLGCVLIDR